MLSESSQTRLDGSATPAAVWSGCSPMATVAHSYDQEVFESGCFFSLFVCFFLPLLVSQFPNSMIEFPCFRFSHFKTNPLQTHCRKCLKMEINCCRCLNKPSVYQIKGQSVRFVLEAGSCCPEAFCPNEHQS